MHEVNCKVTDLFWQSRGRGFDSHLQVHLNLFLGPYLALNFSYIYSTMKYEFEKKWPDRFNSIRFNVNYWMLKKLGLNGFGFYACLWGVIVTVIIYEFFVLD